MECTAPLKRIYDYLLELASSETEDDAIKFYEDLIQDVIDVQRDIGKYSEDKTWVLLDNHTIELLDVIKKYNEDASYNKVILFLILQYGERLQEHHPEALEILNEKEGTT